MILNEDQARERLESPNNLINRLFPERALLPAEQPKSKVTIIEKPHAGKRPELPRFLKTQLAISAHLGGVTQSNLAQIAGTTQSEVSQLKLGKRKELDEDAIEKALGPVRDLALEKLMSSMGMIDEEKLSKCKPLELSTIAANMSRVVDKTIPKKEQQANNQQANVIIYAPQIRTEQSYKVVEI